MDQDFVIYYHYRVLDSKIIRGPSLKAAKEKLQRRLNKKRLRDARVDGGMSVEEDKRLYRDYGPPTQ